MDLLAAIELATDRAIQDYTRALHEEGGLLPRQWSQGASLRLRPKQGAVAAMAGKGLPGVAKVGRVVRVGRFVWVILGRAVAQNIFRDIHEGMWRKAEICHEEGEVKTTCDGTR